MNFANNYIKQYLDRWGDEGLPPIIMPDENMAEVNENCKRCLEEGKRYDELFGTEEYDGSVLY